MENPRKYGSAPYIAAAVHGGPGALGEMAQLARELSKTNGILEPIQTEMSIEGQISELHSLLQQFGEIRLTFIGHSCGAWLSMLYAARYPQYVRKLVLVGCPPLDEQYAASVMETRLNRLRVIERKQFYRLIENLKYADKEEKDDAFRRLGEFISKIDAYDLLSDAQEEIIIEYRTDIFHSVWNEARELRKSGKLTELVRNIQCPILVIHGDYDPHPFEGVQKPLSRLVKSSQFILLQNCGHKPWIERQAKDRFYEILTNSLSQTA